MSQWVIVSEILICDIAKNDSNQRFNNSRETNVHTINFMNVERTSDKN
jgi:hypothetical protein